MPALERWQEDARRAVAAGDAMQRRFGARGGGYHERAIRFAGGPPAFEWPYTQALAATLDLAGLPGAGDEERAAARAAVAGLDAYWDARPARGAPGYRSSIEPGGEKYFDDNAWAGLDLLRAHRLTGDTALLDRARAVFAFVLTGWDADSCRPGGVYWKQQLPGEANHDRNTVSTAPNAELGLRLYQATGERSYLDWAARMYAWVDANLRDAGGLYWDHLDAACAIERTVWSYNQGAMIGAGALLALTTGDETSLVRAEDTARAALARFDAEGYRRHGAAFNAIFFRNLLFLHSQTADADLRAATLEAMRGFADAVWDDPEVHQQRTHLFAFGDGPAKLLDHAGMAQIYACLAWDPADYAAIL
ncbi:MAG TPA: glycoside hydrolase family 76 protein [Thermomicrobiales bacterium]|nr:glycoside hydrolase family 76 protein [Thermomicrobiales bacterium]